MESEVIVMVQERVSITLPKECLEWLDKKIESRIYANCSHAIEVLILEAMKNEKKVTVGITLSPYLIEEARKRNLNISQITEQAPLSIIDYIPNQNEPFSLSGGSLFGKRESWCGRRDLNPGRQRGRLMS